MNEVNKKTEYMSVQATKHMAVFIKFWLIVIKEEDKLCPT